MSVLDESLLTPVQIEGVNRLYERDRTFLIAQMGSGKTVVTLTAIADLLADGVVSKVLVVAPLKVARTVWEQEAAGWSHLQHLTVALALGSPKERQAAIDDGADITVVNIENLPWLLREARLPFVYDGLVIDELSKFKATGGAIFKALRPKLKQFKWRVGLTGTPVSEDWLGLFGQMLVMDDGAALGTRAAAYKERYFYKEDYMGYKWVLRDESPSEISKLIAPMVYTLPDYRDELPPIRYQTLEIEMPPSVRGEYDELSKRMGVLLAEGSNPDFDDEVEVVAGSAAVLVGKLQQCASGFLYADGVVGGVRLSNYRIEMAVWLVGEAARVGESVMLCYWFKADYAPLREALEAAGFAVGAVVDGVEKAAGDWNSGKLDVLMLHPRSAGHGLNLAKGGHRVLWFAPVWSRDLWEQTNARLWRRGQKSPVLVQTLVAADSVDGLMVDRVNEKAAFDVLLRKHLGM